MPTVRIVGPGRAGSSLAGALGAAGWSVARPVRRGDDPSDAAANVDLCVIATPDDVIEQVAGRITPVATTVVAHLSGSRGLDVLEPHLRRAAMHPLASLPDPVTGAATLSDGVWWAVEGDPRARDVVREIAGRIIEVSDRAAYHAAACVAANHLVTLMAQVERIAAAAGLPPQPFYDLASRALANAAANGAHAALTGPASRGDAATIERHLAALDPEEQGLYLALAEAAGALACK